jgi:hypothetical protein
MEALMHSALTCELRHPQRELGIRNDLGPVVRETGRRELLAERILVPEPIASVQFDERNALGRVLGMQVERQPEDLGVELAPYLLGNRLAEPTERSDVVAPDDDRVLGHVAHGAGNTRRSSASCARVRRGRSIAIRR